MAKIQKPNKKLTLHQRVARGVKAFKESKHETQRPLKRYGRA